MCVRMCVCVWMHGWMDGPSLILPPCVFLDHPTFPTHISAPCASSTASHKPRRAQYRPLSQAGSRCQGTAPAMSRAGCVRFHPSSCPPAVQGDQRPLVQPGTSSCFLSPGFSGLFPLTALEPLGGGEGDHPQNPPPHPTCFSPPHQCCFPLWGSQGPFEDIFSLCDFTLDADFFVFLTWGSSRNTHTCPAVPLPNSLALVGKLSYRAQDRALVRRRSNDRGSYGVEGEKGVFFCVLRTMVGSAKGSWVIHSPCARAEK